MPFSQLAPLRRDSSSISDHTLGPSARFQVRKQWSHDRRSANPRRRSQPSLTRPLRKILRRIRSGFLRKLIGFVEQRGASATVAAEHKNWHWVEKAHNIIVEGDDIYGDGVNVAARIQALADPGGIYISRGAAEQVRDKVIRLVPLSGCPKWLT